ncbi:MAG: hypothetical protein IT556_11985 [Acetobacteraceae bacterium]|nr:hypothetical protein [Acetobacteraceae bacterium]
MILRRPGQQRFAVCDGASTSYDGGGWAFALARQYLLDNDLRSDWLARVRHCYADRRRPADADWLGVLAFERGSFATFLGVSIGEERIVVHAIGDSVLFVVAPDAPVRMEPALSPTEFAARPTLLCSAPGIGAFADDDAAFDAARTIIPRPEGGWQGTRLLAVTDALAAWIVAREDESLARISELEGIAGAPAFRDWCARAIAERRVRYDDCAMLAVTL